MTNWPGSPGYGGSDPGGQHPYSAPPTNFDPMPPSWNPAPPPSGGWASPTGQPGNWSPQGAPQWQVPPPPPPPPGNRKKWWIIGSSVAAVVVVLLVLSIVLVVNVGGGDDKPGDAVKGYLEALSRGDADAALSYAVGQPASKKFLTDEILKEQIDEWPITNIRILSDDTSSLINTSRVHVAADFGDKTSDETVSVKKVDGKWKLEHGVNKLEVSNTASADGEALKTVELFGEPLGDNTAVYLFPGWADLASKNKNLTVKGLDKPMLLNTLSYGIGTRLYLQFEVSDQGKNAIQSALRSALEKCAQSTQLKPPGCPNSVSEPGLADGTAAWRAPTDLSGVQIGSLDRRDLTVNLYGKADFGLTVKTTTGETKTGTDHAYINGEADMSASPPEVKLGR